MPIIDLMSELPYAAALSADEIPHRCLFCFLPTKPLINCEKCKVVYYCNEKCQKSDIYEHEPECKAYRNWRIAQKGLIEDANAAYGDEKLRLLARIIRRHHRDGGNVDLTVNRPKSVKVRKLSDLMSHKENLLRDAVRSMHLQDYVSDLYGYFANTTEELSPFYTTVDEIEELVGKMSINCFGIPVTTPNDEIHIGIAIYLTSSRFDHTCKPNLFMDFEEDKSPDYDKLTVSYGCAPSFSGCTAVPTRHQRQLSLSTRYYFTCKCIWCSDDKDWDMSESASTRLCKICGTPYMVKPGITAGFVLCQMCECPAEDIKFKDYFAQDEAAKDLNQLIKEWCTTFHPTENLRSAIEIISKLEPLRRLAHRYWHPTLNLRYVQLNETLFYAYRAISLTNYPPFISPISLYPIPDPDSITAQDKAKALIAGCIAGEMVLSAYELRLEPYETVMARFCYQLAELYELRENLNGALKHYEKALKIWQYHGHRGEMQSNVIKSSVERVIKQAALKQSGESVFGAMNNLKIGGKIDKDEKEDKLNEDKNNEKEENKQKKIRKRKK